MKLRHHSTDCIYAPLVAQEMQHKREQKAAETGRHWEAEAKARHKEEAEARREYKAEARRNPEDEACRVAADDKAEARRQNNEAVARWEAAFTSWTRYNS